MSSFATLLSRLDPPMPIRSPEKKEPRRTTSYFAAPTKILENAVTKVRQARTDTATRFVRVHATLREVFTLANVSVACGAVLCVVGGAGAAYNVVTLRSFLGCAVYLVAGAYAVLSGSPRARNALRAHGLALLPPSMRAALFEKYVVDVDGIFSPSPRVVFTRRGFPSVQVAAGRAHRPQRAPGHRQHHRHGKCLASPGGGGAVRGLGKGRGTHAPPPQGHALCLFTLLDVLLFACAVCGQVLTLAQALPQVHINRCTPQWLARSPVALPQPPSLSPRTPSYHRALSPRSLTTHTTTTTTSHHHQEGQHLLRRRGLVHLLPDSVRSWLMQEHDDDITGAGRRGPAPAASDGVVMTLIRPIDLNEFASQVPRSLSIYII